MLQRTKLMEKDSHSLIMIIISLLIRINDKNGMKIERKKKINLQKYLYILYWIIIWTFLKILQYFHYDYALEILNFLIVLLNNLFRPNQILVLNIKYSDDCWVPFNCYINEYYIINSSYLFTKHSINFNTIYLMWFKLFL